MLSLFVSLIMSYLLALLRGLRALILSDLTTADLAYPQLLDLPIDVLPLILGQTQWSARRTCRAFLDHQSAGRTSLKLRWGKDDPGSSEQLAGLLAQLPRLVALQCVDTTRRVRDISPIAAVGHRLQSLELCDFLLLEDISSVGLCAQLSSFKISTIEVLADSSLVDLRPLSSCKRLTDVDLSGCVRLFNLSPLAACVRITSLKFSDTTDVSDLSPLSILVELMSLHLGSRCPHHIDALAACTKLTELGLLVYNTNPPPLTPLTSCRRLSTLYLCSSCNGADLLPLAQCPLLAELTLYFCTDLSDVGVLQKLLRLQSLRLFGCFALRDISPLSHCMMLQNLCIGHWDASLIKGFLKSIRALKAAKPKLSVWTGPSLCKMTIFK